MNHCQLSAMESMGDLEQDLKNGQYFSGEKTRYNVVK
jgi:hypothetical protein